MTVVNGIKAMAAWLEEEVCPEVELKVPSNTVQTQGYEYELARPVVHEMYVAPAKLASGKGSSMCPGIIVQMVEGSDGPGATERSLRFRLTLCVWDPGTHPSDRRGQEAFEANADGWIDAWNFLDVLLRKLHESSVIGGALVLDRERPVSFGPYKEDGAVIDFYPCFFSECDFWCRLYKPVQSRQTLNQFL